METTILQSLKLKAGQKAMCTAGYPHRGTIIVECIKDFSEAPKSSDIIDNPFTYVNVVDNGRFGALTSHWISSNWFKIKSHVIHPTFGRGKIIKSKVLTENKLGNMLYVQFENDCIWVDSEKITYEN